MGGDRWVPLFCPIKAFLQNLQFSKPTLTKFKQKYADFEKFYCLFEPAHYANLQWKCK